MTRTRGEGRGDSEKAQVVVTPLSVLRAQAARRKAEEEAWAARNGPVETRKVPVICMACGNDEATVLITGGQQVCGDCAEELDP